MIRFIQGFYYQDIGLLDVVFLSEADSDPGVVIKNGIFKSMFAGVIFPSSNDNPELIGEMHDYLGYSRLTKVRITPKEVRFTKKYDHRPDTINYSFRFDPEKKLWIGKYSGEATGEGGAMCVINEVPDFAYLAPQ